MLSLLKYILDCFLCSCVFLFSLLLIPRFWRFHCVCVQVWFLSSRRVARKQRRAVRMISCRTCLLAGVWTSSVGKELTSTMGPGQTGRGEHRWTKQNQHETWTNRFLEYKLTVGGISFKDISVFNCSSYRSCSGFCHCNTTNLLLHTQNFLGWAAQTY